MKLLPMLAPALLLLMTEAGIHGRDDGKADQLHKQLIGLRRQYNSISPGPQSATAREPTPAEIRAYKDKERIRKEMIEVALKLAEADPGSDRGLAAIDQRMDFGVGGIKEFELLSKHYATKEHISNLLHRYVSRPAKKHELDFMKAIILNNKNVKDVAQARFQFALATRDTETEQAIQEFERLVAELAQTTDRDLKRLAAEAEGIAFDHRMLAVGKTVPELEARDTDGVPLKLSDYRGKVVLLHFWGHWQYGGGKWGNEKTDETVFTADKRALVQKMEGKPFVLLGINTDGNLKEIQKMNIDRKVNWRSFWCGPLGYFEPLAIHWNFRHGAQFLVINHQGIIAGKNVGDFSRGALKFDQDKELNTMLNRLVKMAEESSK